MEDIINIGFTVTVIVAAWATPALATYLVYCFIMRLRDDMKFERAMARLNKMDHRDAL